MSKLALFSDIHGNLEALTSIIEDARNQGVTNFACLGDLVGYGPDPGGCVAKVQEIGCVCVKGNHDEDASNDRDLWNLSEVARESLTWTRERLSESQKQWLRELPYQKRLGRHMLVHATLDDPSSWQYIHNKFDAQIALSDQKQSLCFFGHTHVPVAYSSDGSLVKTIKKSKINLASDLKYLVNVGSVGQPRDGNPKACYVIFDSTKKTIQYQRVDYNIERVVEELSQAGLSENLSDRLRVAA